MAIECFLSLFPGRQLIIPKPDAAHNALAVRPILAPEAAPGSPFIAGHAAELDGRVSDERETFRPALQIGAETFRSSAGQRDHSLLVALTGDSRDSGVEVEILDEQSRDLGNAAARRVHHFQDGVVPQSF